MFDLTKFIHNYSKKIITQNVGEFIKNLVFFVTFLLQIKTKWLKKFFKKINLCIKKKCAQVSEYEILFEKKKLFLIRVSNL